MPTPLGFETPPDNTTLANVFARMRTLATQIDTYLRGQTRSGTAPVVFSNSSVAIVTVNHGLGAAPSFADATVFDTTARTFFCQTSANVTSTQVVFYLVNRDNVNITLSSNIAWKVEK